eukprot:m.352078 g.352078  ORF g.352078 m.352078 type:complete len:93 (-) comp16580_c1_seq15:4796-5074(-)
MLASTCPNLVEVNLAGCILVGDPAFEAIGSYCKALEHINASDTELTDSGLVALSEGCVGLTFVSFAGCFGVSNVGRSAVVRNCKNMAIFSVR